MKTFRIFLIALFVSALAYTIIVGNNHGWDLFNVFFTDMSQMAWAGQFDLDFLTHLLLSGLWVAWRNKFTAKGIVLGLFATVGGILFTSMYLLWLSYQCNDSFEELLIGRKN